MTDDGQARFWDRLAVSYSKQPVKDEGAYQRTLDRTSDLLKPTDEVLELGCGTGSTALRLAPGVKSYLATDISSGMIEIAKNKLENSPTPSLSFRVGTAEASLAEEVQFDAILAFNLLLLLRNIPETLRGIHSRLKEGGLFVSKTECWGAMNLMIKLALPVARAVGKAPYLNPFREPELLEQIEAAGFEIVKKELHGSKDPDRRPFIVARKV